MLMKFKSSSKFFVNLTSNLLCSLDANQALVNERKGMQFYLSTYSFLRWSTNWGHCKLKLTMNTNQVKSNCSSRHCNYCFKMYHTRRPYVGNSPEACMPK